MNKIKEIITKYWPRRWVMTALTVAAILYLTLVPRPLPDEMVPMIPGLDKVVHAIMFGTLAFVIAIDMGHITRRRLIIPFIASLGFGGIIEILQNAMHMGRGGDPLDFLADAIGCFIATICIRKMYI